MKVKSNSQEMTFEIGLKIAKLLKQGDVISLNGDLGAGKTHLVKGIAKGLEVHEDITSPTFTIVNEYDGKMPLYHFDVYRISDISELYEIGFEEYIYGEGVSVIEWGNLVEELLPDYTIKINIRILDDNTREIEILNFNKELIL
ncbi:tRNA (adenosine(37)-N6)-threonylcarbamoyltransferase complex ATPase subunit type 1 TsaE [Caloramator sp. Dgby_cultured_2]|uniref:tRNA (adenosine(37)-N6)-threonylcarbamoyltransferase complex ATPase subunit type 1 TsaE n=1 Tax=Caloramator sp. Dgby_cultured_2 TaxID=3029174 RepID=UPI00237ED46A|nr:tRNA (adenosine(37)-N6)-threonylcarbamoyltransferase complex ATPase subunit type 1 TsaE [Caloramator sp. Dgby_cultured_2]WDU82547.1 tRNA (adenosine(37)-N6)-threonylcarbamoyltransferase complex ATPase subunit type 1 TsaE [Caloramator sp. Dgby_cultured_2]